MDWSGIYSTLSLHDNINPETKHYFAFYIGTIDGRDRQSITLVNLPF